MSSPARESQASLMNVYDNVRTSEVLVLSEDSGRASYRGKRCAVVLTEDTLTVFALDGEANNRVLNAYQTEDIIGLRYTKREDKKPAQKREPSDPEYLVEIFAYCVHTGCCASAPPSVERQRRREVLSLVFRCEEALCARWWNAVQHVVRRSERESAKERDIEALPALSLTTSESEKERDRATHSDVATTLSPLRAPRVAPHSLSPSLPSYSPRKILLFVNPASGAGTALRIYEREVEPMLREASVEVECVVTTHAGHAKEVISRYDAAALLRLHSVCVVGGDGLLFEVVQGVAARHDSTRVFSAVSLVAIPGGTGNGLAKGVLFQSREAFSPRNAVFVALRGRQTPLDLSRVETKKGASWLSFLSLTWGLVADIDILSEGLRCLGEARVFLAAAYFIAARRTYAGRVRMQLVERPRLDEISLARAFSSPSPSRSGVAPSLSSSLAEKMRVNALIDTDDREPDRWVSISGEFVLVWVVQTSHVSASVFSAPGKRMDDGFFTLYLVHSGISRAELLSLMLDVDSGKHVLHDKLRVFQCSQYSLIPLTKKGLFSLDGEVVDYTALSVTMLPSAARTIVL